MTPRRRHQRTARARTFSPKLVALVALIVGILAPALALALGSTTPTGAATAGADRAPGIVLAKQSSWVAPEGSFDVTLVASGTSPDDRLDITVYDQVDTRAEFDQSVRGEALGRPRTSTIPALALADFDTVTTADGDLQFDATFPVSATSAPVSGIELSQAGVYPVRIALTDAEGNQLDWFVTHLIRLPATDSIRPLAFSLVVPIHAPPTFQPDGSPVMDPLALTTIQDAVEPLRTHAAVPVTLRPTPETLLGLTALDQAAAQAGQPSDQVASVRAATAGRQILGATFVDLDIGAWLSAPPPADAEFAAQLASGADTVAALLGVRPDTRTTIADPTTTPEALTSLRFIGTNQLVVPEDQLTPLPTSSANSSALQTFDIIDGNGEAIRSVASDPALVDRLTQTDDAVLNGHLLLADLALLWDSGTKPRGAVLAVPQDLAVDAETYDAILDGLADRSAGSDASPVVSAVTIDDLFRVTTQASNPARPAESLVRGYTAAPTGSIGELAQDVNDARSEVDSYRTVLGPEQSRATNLERQLLIAGARGLDDPTRAAYLDNVTTFISDQYRGIVAPDDQRVTLTAETGKLPITLENQLDYEVQVLVVLSSVKLEFPESNSMLVTLPPASATRVEMEVVSRASGAFPVAVTVRTPDEQVVVATTRFTVRSTAISGIGLVLSISAGLFLLVWWALHFRKTRRAKRLVASNHPSMR